MARAPIATRKGFFERVNRNSPIVRVSEYQIVDFTEIALGTAIEPRPFSTVGDGTKILDNDLLDSCPDSMTLVDSQDLVNNFQGVHSFGGSPRDFSY